MADKKRKKGKSKGNNEAAKAAREKRVQQARQVQVCR